ncbi:MobA/MobL family protein [Acidithiobacillus ferriphilus]|uniref:MobQ family relaxase n=1 Tax=Acidithiobacillus ferriphilus TaxID=1689834 RepID=UPI001C06448F|nr:MobQ family relaxase [Acidithiobacillus ferriphilus]MBU2785892.1 MobA/MobL family protein [Acidithiobacillus ferriphilus]
MAIYHASTKPIARSAGRSAVAAAAYRAGVELVDARTGLVHDYTRKGGVELTEILTPDGLGVERNALWNAAELAEKRKDARTAREWIVALPAELDAGQRTDLARDFAQALVARYGVAVDLAIHAPDREGDHRNHHAHLLTTTRQVSRAPDGGLVLGAKAHIELSDKARRERSLGAAADEVKAVRALWENTANAALERAGVEARIDARSLQAQGVDREATQHLGPVASEMERRGKESDRGDGNREVSVNNEERARLSAEIIDLQAERTRRERREAARREFEASHREVRPDFWLTDRLVAGAVVQSAMRERADIQLRWNDRCRMHAQAEKERQARQAAVLLAQRQDAARLAAIEAERETRRQKLLELAELIRTDQEAKANLRQAYAAAGYRLEERDGKGFWVYPHADLKAEKDAAYAARQAWNARKAALKAQRLEQDRATEQETRPGIRHPQRSTWQAWRAQTLTRKYNPAYSAEMAERDIYCRWMPEDGGLYLRLGKAEVIDQGPLILAKNGTGDIPLMIDTAQAKGWASLEFTGDAAFQEQAAMAALRAGLNVADADLARRAAEALEVQDRQGKLRALAETLRADVDTKMDVRKAYLAAGYVVEPREGGAVLVYPPGDLPEARKAVTEARKDWNERAGRSRAQPERREPKAQISAYGAEYARRDGWKGTFTGAVIAVDEGHVYVGAKGGGVAPHCIAIPKERFKTLPSKGLYATFTPGDAQRPAGWNKVLGKMNGQGRLVRDQGKGQGIGD